VLAAKVCYKNYIKGYWVFAYMNKSIVLFCCLTLSACSLTETNQIEQGAETVRLFEDYQQVQHCQFISEVIGTQGHWYDYLFISNRNLTQGAINSLKNEARKVSANAVHVHTNMAFSTSVTLLGQAYNCPNT
jgi:hypothetical protein